MTTLNLSSQLMAIKLSGSGADYLTNRVLTFTILQAHPGWMWTFWALLAALALNIILFRLARRLCERQQGSLEPVARLHVALIIDRSAAAGLLAGGRASCY
ncbi:hypothetical protein [Klebsiella quasipneumoniae]|uniref:hypothetical protein n=1 Tax=Klebsiella quasipneumoniae TaxID=1463165 RepID=UPI0010838256|nr:hypothetical protein [Klebsiella quasipneumoniae]HBX6198975.1 hypothetical protein [Klebsiella pneumoniae]